VLWIFIALKNPSSSARFEPTTLDTMASMIATRSPRPIFALTVKGLRISDEMKS
jgi:hypothetical protein